MADDFSQSLTPPVSPTNSLCELTSAKPPWFYCCESKEDPTGALSSEGYTATGSLKRLLLSLDPAPADYEGDTVELFGFTWVTETALVESTKLLFGLLRLTICKLETLAQCSSRDFGQKGNLHYEASELRQQCVSFLQYVKVFLHRYLRVSCSLDADPLHPYEKLEGLLSSVLLEELVAITLLIGRLKDLPANIQNAFTIQNPGKIFPPPWHLLHLHLDIHWSVLEILHLLGQKMNGQVVYAHQFVNLTGENLTDTSLFEEHLCSLLCDLTGLAMGKYSKVRPTEVLSSHHYLCSCTKELWILVIHLLEYRSKRLHSQSFWSYMNSLLKPLVAGTPAAEQFRGLPAHCKDPLGFTWWLITHLAMLGQYSQNGIIQDEKPINDNWTFAEELLKFTCKPQGGLVEEQIRMHVHCCLSLCLLWKPSTSAVSTLWDFFSKNLGASFTVPWLGLSGLGTLCKTPLSLLEQARNCCVQFPLHSLGHTQLYCSANSFHIFLRVLALCLSQDRVGGVPQRQIKGRICSKFSSKKMQELSEAGLMNFLLLFLVVAQKVELEDIASKTCELLGYLPSDCPPKHRTLVWRGQLALVLLFQEKGLDVGPLATGLASSFSDTAKEFYDKTTEMSRKLALWGPLGSYLEGVAEVFETSISLNLSEEKLLNEGFVWLLPACRQSELNSVLGFLQTVLAQLRQAHQRCVQPGPPLTWTTTNTSVVKEPHLAVAAALWLHFFPFLRNLRLSQTPPIQLADAAAGFTFLAFELPASAPQDLQPNPVHSILQCFGWDDMVHPLLVTRYLPHLLQNRELVSSLSSNPGVSSSASAQCQSVRAWFRCVLQQHLHKCLDGSDSRADRVLEEQLCELTRLVLLLPEVESLLQTANLLRSGTRTEPTSALEMFVKAVGIVYSRLQSLSERSAMVTRALDYMGDILKHIKPSLVSKNPNGIQLAYWAVGCIVKHWSPLLVTSKAQQLLFRIVDRLLLPNNLTQQDKALRDSLPLYLQGLSVASSVSQSQGAYLKQQLHSIIRRYLDHFLPASPSVGAIANHPVLLGACEVTPTIPGASLRRTILEVLRENFLQFKGHSPPPRLAPVLLFLFELLRRNSDSDPALLTLPLPSLLHCLMLVSEPQVRKTSTDAVQLVVERCAAASAEGACLHLISVLKSFVEENERVYDKQIYSVLETVAVLDPPAVQALIPTLSLSLRNTEHKRGLGKNTTLRNAYKKLLCLLGESGQAEIASLELD
nr:protein MMS22-like isoform X2 [Doryrhamphus excisus]XP_057909185.1 protein MMS22-like isoform X2 [Doryrhamphus excisus]XP_057909186.1 protein MMS22-like isoform X2 [Doryrhamphus excisus]XP_057909187.1 protein MMS22-like isoform X2 [Doryrhamphus excisus]XP_057909189.1 protein MMS22-like isoform X2 [Doryrhamphus excisus]XP_057909190.1 protein MMS22-like isoform X2 [Doryrhamphus excisus]